MHSQRHVPSAAIVQYFNALNKSIELRSVRIFQTKQTHLLELSARRSWSSPVAVVFEVDIIFVAYGRRSKHTSGLEPLLPPRYLLGLHFSLSSRRRHTRRVPRSNHVRGQDPLVPLRCNPLFTVISRGLVICATHARRPYNTSGQGPPPPAPYPFSCAYLLRHYHIWRSAGFCSGGTMRATCASGAPTMHRGRSVCHQCKLCFAFSLYFARDHLLLGVDRVVIPESGASKPAIRHKAHRRPVGHKYTRRFGRQARSRHTFSLPLAPAVARLASLASRQGSGQCPPRKGPQLSATV